MSDRAYLAHRVEQESLLADQATHPAVKAAHAQLASAYRQQLDTLTCRTEDRRQPA